MCLILLDHGIEEFRAIHRLKSRCALHFFAFRFDCTIYVCHPFFKKKDFHDKKFVTFSLF